MTLTQAWPAERDPKVHGGGAGKGEGAGKKRKKLFSSSPSPLFLHVNLSLGINFWFAPTLGQSKVHIDRTAKYACFAGQHGPCRRALICWLLFCIKRAFEVLGDLQDPVCSVSTLGCVCVYFEVNSTLTAYPHRTLHPRPHNRNSFCQLLIFQLLLGDVRGTQRLFSVNICSEKQILPRICYYLRTAKNF